MNHTGHFVLAASDGCDVDESDPEEYEDGCWYFWERSIYFCALVVACYKSNPDVDTDAHEKGGASDSESDDEE